MKISKQEYTQMSQKASMKSPVVKDCLFAFLIGGGICALGQGLINLYTAWGVQPKDSRTLCSATLVFVGALLTTVGVYDKLAKVAGAGSLVPITGFANSIVSPAIEFKTEGYVLGLGAKMFIIAGPVLVYGITASVLYGTLYYIYTLFL